MYVFQQKGCKAWRVRFTVEGQRYDLPLHTRSKELAHEKARKLVIEKEREAAGLIAPKAEREAARTPLPELLRDWVDNGVSPESDRKHRRYCINRPTKVFCDCGWNFLRDISPRDFEVWRRAQLQSGEIGPRTLNEYFSHLSGFLRWLEEQGMIATNPMKAVKRLPVQKQDSLRAFTTEELAMLMAAVPPYRGWVYRIAAFTGLRRAELKALKWSRVDLYGHNHHEHPCIELEAAKTKNRKGGTLLLHPEAQNALRELRKAAHQTEELVFYKGVTQMERFRKDLKVAGIAEKDARGRTLEFHSFRRTFATMLRQWRVSPEVARQLMRHSDIRLTMQLYPDEHLLPMVTELNKLPSLPPSPSASPETGNTCPNVSKAGKEGDPLGSNETPENVGFRVELAPVGQGCPSSEMADREGFEPSIPFWSILP